MPNKHADKTSMIETAVVTLQIITAKLVEAGGLKEDLLYCLYMEARKACASCVDRKVRTPPVKMSLTTSALSKATHS